MIGNAHLDPVWMWRWQEGSAQVKATISSALDRMNETPDFKFVSSQAVMYEWLSEFTPEMIDEIKKRVAEGRFIICGGWWVQPDCNLPSGESFARHGLYSQRLFKKLLGTTAKVGYNVDSFGHNAMLPQILKKSGMNAYIMMRPGEHEKHLESNLFMWRSPDGTELPVYRIPEAYCNNYSTKEDMLAMIERTCDKADKNWDETLCFYGVGNHGGGPTKLNIGFIKELQKEHPECEIVFGDPSDFFKKLLAGKPSIPVVDDDLQHHASGCYSTLSKLKKLNRECENRLYAAECYSAAAEKLLGIPYSTEKFETAWRNVLFNQFHDSLGGCSVRDVYTDAFEFAGEALSIASKTENKALQAISWKIDTSAMNGTPVIVFNPHPFKVKTLVRVNAKVESISTTDGEKLPCQKVLSQVKSCYGRDDTIFEATLPPMGYKTYLMGNEAHEAESRASADGNILENELLKVTFDKTTGYISSIYDKEAGRELICSPAAVPIVVDETAHDTWSHAMNYFDRDIGCFTEASLAVIENGPIRAKLKVTNRYFNSELSQYYSLTAGVKRLDVSCELNWNEKHRMLKLSFPIAVSEPRVDYEIPFGHFERPCDGEEEPGHRYIVLHGKEFGMALLNDSKYSFSVKDSDMRLTAVRSPIYGDHGGARTSESEYMDLGRQSFKYSLLPVASDPDYSAVTNEAALLNCPTTNIIENNHKGTLAPENTFVQVSDGIALSAFKKSEEHDGYIVRVYEDTGKPHTGVVNIPLLGTNIISEFGKFEVKTFNITSDGIHELLLTEFEK